jgi:hypothetical protein
LTQSPTHPFAKAIATAAFYGFIDSGTQFRPDDPINRAEAARLIALAREVLR